MKARLQRTLIALVTVLVVYQLYSVIAVPLIEPDIGFVPSGDSVLSEPPSVRSFAKLFPPGSWELKRPKILETDQGTLLFDEYETFKDGRIRLNRCTLVYDLASRAAAPQRRGDPAPPAPRPVVLRAESGATIYFDGPLNLLGGKLGRVVGGRLDGEITIFSPPSSAAADDALEIFTQGVQIDRQRIWTPHAVRFRFGRNRGAGRDFSIQLQPRGETATGLESPGRASHIKSLELVHLDGLEIHTTGDLFQLAGGKPPRSPADSGTAPASRPVEIRCRGPFRFDFVRNIASLAEHVDVIRHNHEGPSDQLNCELLELHFRASSADPAIHSQQADGAPPQQPTLGGLQPKKIVAIGYPAMVRVPSNGSFARAERIEYEFTRRRVWLKDRQKLTLGTATFLAQAPELEYEIPARGQLGRLWASGPGSLRGNAGGEGNAVAVEWSEQIRLVPQAEMHVLSVHGTASASFGGAGNLAADKIHLYLHEQPNSAPGAATSIGVQRMRATGQVRVDSPRFSSTVSEAKVWFAGATAQATAGGADLRSAQPTNSVKSTTSRSAPVAKFHLSGDVLHAQVMLGDTPRLKRLSVSGQVRLSEVAAATGPPITFSGDRLELADDHNELRAELSGQPATASLRGLSLLGARLWIDQRQNQVQVFGPGTMTLPQPRSSSVHLPPVRVRWTGGMTFDGQQARFEQNVTAAGTHLTDKGEKYRFSTSSEFLDVALTQRVKFADSETASSVDVRQLRFPGNVFLTNQRFDYLGAQKSDDQMQVSDLVLNMITGRVHASGPGWLVHREQTSDAGQRTRFPLASIGGESQLAFLRVDFQREMTGNLRKREVVFTDRVASNYGPISAWNETLRFESTQSLGERDVLLTCQRLAAADMRSSGGGSGSLELQATGNASIIGKSFSGTGERISYSRDKDQLILKGDGRSEALLRFRKIPGAQPVELRVAQVLFYPGTKDFKLQGIHSLDVPDTAQFRDAQGVYGFPQPRATRRQVP